MLPWVAHLYTGLGVVAALAATLAVVRGDYREAFLWLGLQIFIDATDGVLARALRVKERLPQFDGGKLDDLIDYLTYVFIPVLIALHAGLLPPALGLWIGSIVLLASGYGFSQSSAKVRTSDYFFTGFPSYWNLVVVYLFLLQISPLRAPRCCSDSLCSYSCRCATCIRRERRRSAVSRTGWACCGLSRCRGSCGSCPIGTRRSR